MRMELTERRKNKGRKLFKNLSKADVLYICICTFFLCVLHTQTNLQNQQFEVLAGIVIPLWRIIWHFLKCNHILVA